MDRLDPHLLDLTLPTPEANLALDECLLLAAESGAGRACLRFWESREYTVIVGSSRVVAEDVDVEACRHDRVPILRRCSGGGTVLLGPGCLAFTLVLSIAPDWERLGMGKATAVILERLRTALQVVVPEIEACGTSDLAVDGRKVSGNAQRWLRRTVLHHGTLLYDFEIDRVSWYLRLPERQPAYRNGRQHGEFLANLPAVRAVLQSLLISAWQANGSGPVPPDELVAKLVKAKYASEAWNFRR